MPQSPTTTDQPINTLALTGTRTGIASAINTDEERFEIERVPHAELGVAVHVVNERRPGDEQRGAPQSDDQRTRPPRE